MVSSSHTNNSPYPQDFLRSFSVLLFVCVCDKMVAKLLVSSSLLFHLSQVSLMLLVARHERRECPVLLRVFNAPGCRLCQRVVELIRRRRSLAAPHGPRPAWVSFIPSLSMVLCCVVLCCACFDGVTV